MLFTSSRVLFSSLMGALVAQSSPVEVLTPNPDSFVFDFQKQSDIQPMSPTSPLEARQDPWSDLCVQQLNPLVQVCQATNWNQCQLVTGKYCGQCISFPNGGLKSMRVQMQSICDLFINDRCDYGDGRQTMGPIECPGSKDIEGEHGPGTRSMRCSCS